MFLVNRQPNLNITLACTRLISLRSYRTAEDCTKLGTRSSRPKSWPPRIQSPSTVSENIVRVSERERPTNIHSTLKSLGYLVRSSRVDVWTRIRRHFPANSGLAPRNGFFSRSQQGLRWIYAWDAFEWSATAFAGGSCIESAVSHLDRCQGRVGGAGKYGGFHVDLDVDGGRRW